MFPKSPFYVKTTVFQRDKKNPFSSFLKPKNYKTLFFHTKKKEDIYKKLYVRCVCYQKIDKKKKRKEKKVVYSFFGWGVFW